MRKLIFPLILLTVTAKVGAADPGDWFRKAEWLAAVIYRQDENTIYFDTTGKLPPQVKTFTAATANVVQLELSNLRVNPQIYTLAPHDGVVDAIRVEGKKHGGSYTVVATIELVKPFPFEVDRRQTDGDVSQVVVRLTGVDVARPPADAPGKVALRARAGADSPVVAFLPFHTRVRVLEFAQGYYLVRTDEEVAGWVPEKNLKIEGENPFRKTEPALVADDPRARVVATAKKYLGRPYVWGGTGPDGFDCSGLVQTVFAENGINLPRGAGEQYRQGKKISKSALRPGDLVFFHTYTSGPSHVGIYVGGGKFIHAESSPRGVTVTPLDEPYWKERWLGARTWLGD